MNQNDSPHELLLRHLDGRLTPDERRRTAELLRTDPEARVFLRAVAEQAVMVADLERVALGRQEALQLRPLRPADQGRKILPVRFRSWRWGVAAAAAVAVLAVLASQLVPTIRLGSVRVSKVTGSSQYFGFKGRAEKVLTAGTSLVAGDTLETRSCDGLA